MDDYEGKIEFPKWVYLRDGTAVLCPDLTALAAIPEGTWAENPAHWTTAAPEAPEAPRAPQHKHKGGK